MQSRQVVQSHSPICNMQDQLWVGCGCGHFWESPTSRNLKVFCKKNSSRHPRPRTVITVAVTITKGQPMWRTSLFSPTKPLNLEARVGEAVNWRKLKNNLCAPNSGQHSSVFPWTHTTGYDTSVAVFSLLVHKYLQLLSLNSYVPSPTLALNCIFIQLVSITYYHISRLCSKSLSLEGIYSLPLHLSLVLVSMDSVVDVICIIRWKSVSSLPASQYLTITVPLIRQGSDFGDP